MKRYTERKMESTGYSRRNEIALFIGAFLLYLAIVLIFQYWFVGDEGYYSVSIYEALKNGPNLYITFLGVPVFWKPFLMVDVYALIAGPLSGMPAQIAYRIPSVLFSAINVVLVYALAKEFVDEKKALLTSIVYALNPIILIFGTKIFMETLAMTFIFAGMYATIALCKGKRWTLGVALAIIGAAFSKSTTIGLMGLLLYAAYAFFANRKKLGSVAVAGAVAALVVFLVPFLTHFPEAFFRLYWEDFFTRRINTNIYGENIFTTMASLLYLLPIILVSAQGIKVKEWKNMFLLLWIIPLIPILILTPYNWYAYYFVFPLVLIALKGISDNVLDKVMIFILVLVGAYIGYLNIYQAAEEPEMKTIEFIAHNISKESCILFAGAINPMSYSYLEINGYKFNVAITNVILANGTTRIYDANISQEQLNKLVNDYENANFIEGITKKKYLFAEWNRFTPEIALKTENYNCTKFDYVIVTDYYRKYNFTGYELAMEGDSIRIWKLASEK